LTLVQRLSAVVCGARLSILMPETVVPGVLLPARSVAASLVALRSGPLPRTSTSLGQLATPESASVQSNPTTTSPRYQPASFGAFVGAPATTGPVRSILMPETEADETLPARSATCTGPAPRSAPSPVITLAAGTVDSSMPERPSVPVQSTATSSRYQPAPLAGVVGVPVSVGAVMSMLMSSSVVAATLPALSRASPFADWPAPSLSTVTGSVQPAMPDSASPHSNVTITGPLVQPKAFAGGTRRPVMVGATPSIRTTTVWPGPSAASTLPARSTLQNVIRCVPLSAISNGAE
jgi:hypothetical protein